MSLLPEAGGQTAVLDAPDTDHRHHRGCPPPAWVCRIARAGVLAESVLEKRSPRPYFSYFQRAKLLRKLENACLGDLRADFEELLHEG